MESRLQPEEKPQALARAIGPWTALALVMGSMIGSGVFLLPASLAPLGWNSVIGWIITVLGTLCMAAVFAQLARAMPKAGGPYAYTRAAFGGGAAFSVAWAYWISMWVGNAAIATAGVSYLSRLFPAIGSPGISTAVTIAFVWLFTAINLRGAHAAGRVQIIATLIKIVPLAAVILLALWVLFRDGAEHIRPFAADDISGASIATAATLTLWAMLGIEVATVPADKVSNPEKTIPRATMLGTGAAGLIYIFVCSAIVLMVPQAVLSASAAPFADFVGAYAGRLWGIDLGAVIAAFGAISALGALNGWIMVQGEMPAAIARDGLFPAWFARQSGSQVPANAHIFSTLLLTLVLLLNVSATLSALFKFLIMLTTSVVLFMYAGCALSALWLMWRRKIPVTAVAIGVAITALIYAGWTVYGAYVDEPATLRLGIILMLAGLPVYWLMRAQSAREDKA
jgi:basic amino acid/polyamine antiporter, APA family